MRGDIYSAGAVLYEMATGRRPFPQTQGPQLMGAILHELPAAPSTLNPQISPGLENGIMKTLEKMPSRRYQSALELQAFLESLTAAVPPGDAHLSAVSEMPFQRTARVEPVARRKLLVGGLLISVLLLAGLLIALNVKGWRDRLMPGVAPNGGSSIPVSTAIKARPSVAVLGFKNVSGRPEEAWLSTALSEMLTTELAVGEQLRTVPGENVARMKIDLSLPDADTYGKETLANIRKNLGTDAVVLGSYVPLEKGQLRLDLRLQNTAAGETMAAVSEKGTEEQLDDLVSRAGVALRRKLGAGAVSDADAASVRAALPSNTEAARLYAEGLAKLRLFDNLAARDLLEKAVAIEPTHALSHSSLAAAWAGLGYDTNAAAEAKRAFDLSQGLSRQDHLSVEGRYRETTREWDKAVEIYKTLFGFFPDNLDYGLALVQSQTRAGNGTAALATVETLRKIPAPQNGDPRIDLAEAIAAQSLSDYTHESKAAARAAEKGQATGARLLLARARLFQSVALRQLGQPKDARAAIEDARQIFAASGDRNGVASADNGIANILSDQGDIQGAKKRFESALAIYREIGNKAGAGKVLGNLATEVSNGGDMAGGRKLCEEALVLLQESGDKTRLANGQNNLATYLTLQGDLAGAADLFRQSLKLRKEIGDKGGEAESLNNLAELLAEQGDVTAAKAAFNESFRLHQEGGQKGASTYQLNGLGKLLLNSGDLAGATQRLEQSQAIAREIEEKPLLSAALAGLGDVYLQQGRLGDARKAFEQALAIDKELGYREEADEISLGLAEVDIEDGRPADAQVLIQLALKGFRNGRLSDNEISGHTLLARAMLAQAQLNDARKQIELGRELAAKSQNRLVVLACKITEARVLVASGNLPAAFALLDSALAEAKKSALVRYELEARLALAEMEVKSGKEVGRSNLAALRNDARAKGFELIANKAAAL